jgi:hypothetical protein
VLYESETAAPETLAGVLAVELETEMRRIYERARTLEEIEQELKALRETMDERRKQFEDIHRRTAGLIESRFDDQVRRNFKRIQDELPARLAELDHDLERVVSGYLDALGVGHSRVEEPGRILVRVQPSPTLPEGFRDGVVASIGESASATDVEPLHLGHPLVHAAVARARDDSRERVSVRASLTEAATPALRARSGQRGRLRLIKVRHEGFEPTEVLFPIVVFEADDEPLTAEDARAVFAAELVGCPPIGVRVVDAALDDALDEALFLAEPPVSVRAQERFQHTVEQIETAIEDRLLVLGRQRAQLIDRVTKAEQARDAATGADTRTRAEEALRRVSEKLEVIDGEIGRLRERDDPDYARWMTHANARRSRPPTIEILIDAELELV